MYRINLYPEYRESRRAQRRKAASTAVLFSLLGIEILLVGALVLSDSLLREQVTSLRSELPQLQERVAGMGHDTAELDFAMDILDVRAGRVDWSPKFSALAEHIDGSLVLLEMSGRTPRSGDNTKLEVNGDYMGKGTNLTTVSAYLDLLREDARLNGDFMSITLGNIRGGGSGEFDIVCETEREVDE